MDPIAEVSPISGDTRNDPVIPDRGTRDPITFEPEPLTRQEVRALAQTLMKSTGMAPKQASVAITAAVLCWAGAALGGLCGLAMWDRGNLSPYLPWSDDLSRSIYILSLAAGLGLPLGLGIQMTQQFRRWYLGLKTREVLLSVVLIPDLGRIVAHGVEYAWRGAFLRYILPLFLLGLGSAAAFYMEGLGRNFSNAIDMLGIFLPVTTLLAFVASPLITGAPLRSRIVVYTAVIIPILAPFWIGMLGAWARNALGGDDARNLLYGTFAVCHTTVFVALVIHLILAPRHWRARLESLAEKA